MAILSSFITEGNGFPLEMYLEKKVFSSAKGKVMEPNENDVSGFNEYLKRFRAGLPVEKAAAEYL